jgi:hypothetical protein
MTDVVMSEYENEFHSLRIGPLIYERVHHLVNNQIRNSQITNFDLGDTNKKSAADDLCQDFV